MKFQLQKLIMIFLFSFLFGCATAPESRAAAVDASKKSFRMSESVRQAVERLYPSFRPYSYRNFAQQIQDNLGIVSNKETPMAVEGDFNGDGSDDLVFFVWAKKPGDNSNNTYLVFVSSYQRAAKAYELQKIEASEMNIKTPSNLAFTLEHEKKPFKVEGVEDGVRSHAFMLNAWGSNNITLYVVRDNQLKTATVSERE